RHRTFQLGPGAIPLLVPVEPCGEKRRQIMTLGEELRKKYCLTSFKARGGCLTLLAINDALEFAAQIADQEHSPMVANRIRTLKWIDCTVFSSQIGAAHFKKAA